MPEQVEYEPVEQWAGRFSMWFAWGVLLSMTTICSLVFLGLLLVSVLMNVYLSWQLSGMEVVVQRAGAVSVETLPPTTAPLTQQIVVVTATPAPVAMAPTSTVDPAAFAPPPTPTESPLEGQLATLSAMATGMPTALPTSTPTPEPTVSALEMQVATLSAVATAAAAPDSGEGAGVQTESRQSGDPQTADSQPQPTNTPVIVAAGVENGASAETGGADAMVLPEAGSYTSSNSYQLIPLEGGRDPRPAEEHGDLNLSLRKPEPIEADLSLIEISGSGIDPDAIKLTEIFKPEIVAAYTVHNWDWGCNCPGEVLDQVAMIGLKTTPGEPVFIPQRRQDIYGGNIFAVVLYASEDSLTFAYGRDGTVANVYAVHYQGLRTDPNLLELYRESKGNELPGLTLDTPVGIATDELRVAIRDQGAFMEPRSLKDWWN